MNNESGLSFKDYAGETELMLGRSLYINEIGIIALSAVQRHLI